MASVDVSLVNPALTRHLPKARHLSLNPLVLELLRRGLDLGESSCALLREEDSLSRAFGPAVSRLWRDEFIPNDKQRSYLLEIDGHMRQGVASLENASSFHVEDWVFKTLVGSLGRALWGGELSPFAEPEFVEHLRTLLLNIQKLNNPMKFLIDQKLLASRRFVRGRFARFSFEEYAGGQGGAASSGAADETFLGRVRKLCLNHGAVAEGWTDYQLLLIAGLGPNVMAAATWLLHHVLSDADRLRRVRDEVDALVGSTAGDVDLANMSTACPLLMASWYESLRLRGGFALGRYVHEDSSLAGTYALRKGSYVLASLGPHHYDESIWGSLPMSFHPERFLDASGQLDEAQRRKLRVFGLFGTLCPGRHLASHMAMAMLVRLLSGFEIGALVPGAEHIRHVTPDECKDAVAGLVTPAWDVEVRIRRRPGPERELKIGFKGKGPLE
jgi:hypothetical protein